MEKRLKSIFIWMLIILVVSALGVFVAKSKAKSDIATKTETLTPVKVQKVGLGAMNQYVQFSGKTKGGEEGSITPAIPAKIKELKVKEGQQVKKGQVLMVLDSEDVDKQLSQAEAAYNRTLQTINQSQNQLESMKKQIEAIEGGILEKKGLMDKYSKENETLVNEIELLRKQLEEKKITEEEFTQGKNQRESKILSNTKELGTITKELAQLEITKATLNKTLESVPSDSGAIDSQIAGVREMYEATLKAKENYTIKSPIDGVVNNLTAKEGEVAVSMFGPVLTVVNTETIGVDLQVTKDDVGKFRVGTQVKVRVETDGVEKDLVGKVKAVANTPDKITNQYVVNININNKDKKIETEKFAKIVFAEVVKNEIISIPKDALIRDNGRVFVYKVEKGVAKMYEVTLGIETDTNIEVLSGLITGEDIIVKGKEYVRDGQKVNVVRGEN